MVLAGGSDGSFSLLETVELLEELVVVIQALVVRSLGVPDGLDDLAQVRQPGDRSRHTDSSERTVYEQ